MLADCLQFDTLATSLWAWVGFAPESELNAAIAITNNVVDLVLGLELENPPASIVTWQMHTSKLIAGCIRSVEHLAASQSYFETLSTVYNPNSNSFAGWRQCVGSLQSWALDMPNKIVDSRIRYILEVTSNAVAKDDLSREQYIQYFNGLLDSCSRTIHHHGCYLPNT